jgi:hypothetical protein
MVPLRIELQPLAHGAFESTPRLWFFAEKAQTRPITANVDGGEIVYPWWHLAAH